MTEAILAISLKQGTTRYRATTNCGLGRCSILQCDFAKGDLKLSATSNLGDLKSQQKTILGASGHLYSRKLSLCGAQGSVWCTFTTASLLSHGCDHTVTCTRWVCLNKGKPQNRLWLGDVPIGGLHFWRTTPLIGQFDVSGVKRGRGSDSEILKGLCND